MPAAHHLPGRPPCQYFVLGIRAFDITAAQNILRGHPRETTGLPVADCARACGPGHDPGSGTIPLLGPGPSPGRDYAMTTGLARPVILATLRSTSGPLALLTDGYARPVTVH